MQPNKRQELEERRRQFQIRQAAEAFVTSSLQPYLEILDYLNQEKVDFKIIQLMYVNSEWMDSVQTTLQKTPYPQYGFHPDHLVERGMEKKMDRLYARYPSGNPLRYVPSLPKIVDYGAEPEERDNNRKGLPNAVASLGLPNQKVFLYYLRYAPITEMTLSDILENDHKNLFNLWHGDAVIFPSDLSWLMVFTLEEEWYAGKYEV